MRAAVVDVGSNSVRLLLMERMDPGGAVGERLVTVTGLRRGAAADGTVTPGAIARLDACLAEYGRRIGLVGSPPVVAVGTSAVREAPNRSDIEAVVRKRLGAELRVVTGEEEAILAFTGARLVMDGAPGPCTVLDIGGGSTEVVEGDESGPARAVSLPLGVNRQGDLVVHDPPTADEVDRVAAEAVALVRGGTPGFRGAGVLIGVAGTVTTVAAVLRGAYDPEAIHGMVITRGDVAQVLAALAAVPASTRALTPGLHPDRVNVIVPGLAMLGGAMDALGAREVVVSERDTLDGVAMGLARTGGDPSP